MSTRYNPKNCKKAQFLIRVAIVRTECLTENIKVKIIRLPKFKRKLDSRPEP